MYFIKNAGSLEYIPHDIDKEIQKAFDIDNEANLGAEGLELQRKKKGWIYIQKSLATKQGSKQEKINFAKKIDWFTG